MSTKTYYFKVIPYKLTVTKSKKYIIHPLSLYKFTLIHSNYDI